jgi:hypothetical protein
LADRLNKLDPEMNARHDQVLEFSEFSHKINDKLERLNLNFLAVLEELERAVGGKGVKA